MDDELTRHTTRLPIMRANSRRWSLKIFLSAIGCCWVYLLHQQHDSLALAQQAADRLPIWMASSSSMAIADAHHSISVPVAESSSMSNSKEKPKETQPRPDALFNNVPVTLVQGPPPASTCHCVGPQEDEKPTSKNDWMYRSCEYTNLCLDTSTGTYLSFSSSTNEKQQPGRTAPPVALGAINPRWMMDEQKDERNATKVQWTPTTIRSSGSSAYSSYYQLGSDVLLVPFHSMAGHNVGHLLWDDLYSLFVLLKQFGYSNNNNTKHRLQLIRQQLSEDTKLYANCDIRRNKRIQCKANFERFLPLFGVDPNTFSTSRQIQFAPIVGDDAEGVVAPVLASPLVCASTALAGIGLLQDHGFGDHGWDGSENVPHNMGRGRLFYEFAQFLQHTVDVATTPTTTAASQPPEPIITFSLRSSRDYNRRQDFTTHMNALKTAVVDNGSDAATVRSFDMRDLNLHEQINVAATTSIFVTTCGGGSMTATFLPRNAALIVFYDAEAGLDFASFTPTGKPARFDWDLLNHAAHLRVHWLPVQTMEDDIGLFVRLVQHELAIARRMLV